jgi:hypothetical protein
MLCCQYIKKNWTHLFSDKINSERYSGQILVFFLNMRDEEYEYRSFQEGGVNTHTANNSMATLHDILVECIINYPSWPAC